MRAQPVATKNPQHTLFYHNWEDYYYAGQGTSKRGNWLDSHYDRDDPEPSKWAFKNGANHRPQFEDRILAKIDNERDLARMKEERYEHERKLADDPFAPLRALAESEAEKLRPRNQELQSWHAPRTPEGLPEGVEEKES